MKKTPLIVGICLIAGILIGYFSYQLPWLLAQNDVQKNLISFYQLALPGDTAEIASLKQQSGIYDVLVKLTAPDGTISYQEAFVTLDGKYMQTADSTIVLPNSITQIQKQKDFVGCLYNKGLRIYGIANQTLQGGSATLLQLNVVGSIYSPSLFISCEGSAVQNCINSNISVVPSVKYGETIQPGVQPLNWFANITGCAL